MTRSIEARNITYDYTTEMWRVVAVKDAGFFSRNQAKAERWQDLFRS